MADLGPSVESKEAFRKELLQRLQSRWNDSATSNAFVEFAELLESQGCGVFAGLIDTMSFQRLIEDFTNAMDKAGSKAFLHSFLALATQPVFHKEEEYN